MCGKKIMLAGYSTVSTSLGVSPEIVENTDSWPDVITYSVGEAHTGFNQ